MGTPARCYQQHGQKPAGMEELPIDSEWPNAEKVRLCLRKGKRRRFFYIGVQGRGQFLGEKSVIVRMGVIENQAFHQLMGDMV